MTKTNENKNEIARTKMTISGLLEILEMRFLRGDEEGCMEITIALKQQRAELARLEN